MSNVLKVSLQTTIYSLADRGWSQRRIASELGINRETAGRYLRLAKPAIVTTGDEEGAGAKPAIPITGVVPGRRSYCEPLAEAIAAKIEVGLSARRISRIWYPGEIRRAGRNFYAGKEVATEAV